MTDLVSRLAGGVWGHLVGDAVGVPYEFRDASAIGEVKFGATGTHHQPPGTWSDDGALMLALLDSLLTTGFDTTDQAQRGLDWYKGTAYTPDGDGRFDIGGATRAAIEAFAGGSAAEKAGPIHERANGNGSLMRILPLALVDRNVSDAELAMRAHRASRVTHGTARAQTACALYSIIVRRLLTGAGGRAAALDGARQSLRDTYEAAGAAEHLGALDHLEGHTARGGHGSVWDAFWSAWDAFAGANDYRETIQRAVAYGNDTDTTAAIAGGLAGIRWGIDGIPIEWLRGMRGRAVAEPLVRRLTKAENPIRVDWVDLKKVRGMAASPGRLGMTFLPGKDEGPAGEHHRVLIQDARWLRAAYAVDALLLLVEDHELDLLRVPSIAPVMAAAGVELIRFPIVDTKVPTDLSALATTLDAVCARLAKGESVAVACRGGLGRTGTVVGCLLCDGGLDATSAIALTRASRPKTIENPDQALFVTQWSDRRGTNGESRMQPPNPTHPMDWERLGRAAQTAARLHADQVRKDTEIPYVSHLFGTCAVALEYGANEDQAIAALLHDVIEDVEPPGVARAEVASFGAEVLRIVEACTDSDVHPKPPWRERKERYIEHLAGEDGAVLLVSASDKLHNARAIVGDLHQIGPAVWDRFNAGSDQLWYYRALVTAFRSNPAHLPALIDALDRTVTEMERLSGGLAE